jgi:hypothetical protein
MKHWNTPDHHIAGTEHGTLILEGDVPLVIADWQYTEDAPDSDGRIYAAVRGWLVNGSGSGRPDDPYTEPVEGRTRLVRSELRGRQPLPDLTVYVDYYHPGQPYPNTWDHRGCLATVSWMDRRIDADGRTLPEDEIGRTEWTHPGTGEVFDLRAAYVPAGDYYDPQGITWQHYDRWDGGVPLLHPFCGDAKAPERHPGGRRITDGDWTKAGDAPTLEGFLAAART